MTGVTPMHRASAPQAPDRPKNYNKNKTYFDPWLDHQEDIADHVSFGLFGLKASREWVATTSRLL